MRCDSQACLLPPLQQPAHSVEAPVAVRQLVIVSVRQSVVRHAHDVEAVIHRLVVGVPGVLVRLGVLVNGLLLRVVVLLLLLLLSGWAGTLPSPPGSCCTSTTKVKLWIQLRVTERQLPWWQDRTAWMSTVD